MTRHCDAAWGYYRSSDDKSEGGSSASRPRLIVLAETMEIREMTKVKKPLLLLNMKGRGRNSNAELCKIWNLRGGSLVKSFNSGGRLRLCEIQRDSRAGGKKRFLPLPYPSNPTYSGGLI